MCNDMIELKNAKARIIELEGELKGTRKDYMDEIVALARHNVDLKQEIEELKGKLASKKEDKYVHVRTTTSSSTTPIRIQVNPTLKTKLEQTSWSLPPIQISRGPPNISSIFSPMYTL